MAPGCITYLEPAGRPCGRDVVVRDQVAVGGEEETGACAGRRTGPPGRATRRDGNHCRPDILHNADDSAVRRVRQRDWVGLDSCSRFG